MKDNISLLIGGAIHKMNEKILMDYCYHFRHTNHFILKALHALHE